MNTTAAAVQMFTAVDYTNLLLVVMSDSTQTIPITGNFIKLYSEGYFNFETPGRVVIEDIAVGLSNTCRFAGQLEKFYSVAEHCVHCVTVANELGCSIDEKRAALMHDAAEAFVGDMPSPLKIMLPGYREIESRVEGVIREQFRLGEFSVVKEIDLMLLRAEKETFMGGQDKWHCLDGVKDCLPAIEIGCWEPRLARTAFMAEAVQLGLLEDTYQ